MKDPAEARPEDAIPMLPVLENNDRLTLITKVYYEHQGEPSTVIESALSILIAKDIDEPYSRRITVCDKLENPFQGSWVPNPGLIVIKNLEGPPTNVLPTKEQLAEVEQQFLWIQIGDVFTNRFKLVPQDLFRAMPVDLSKVMVCAPPGRRIRARVWVYSK